MLRFFFLEAATISIRTRHPDLICDLGIASQMPARLCSKICLEGVNELTDLRRERAIDRGNHAFAKGDCHFLRL
jgi:hypothetical protein